MGEKAARSPSKPTLVVRAELPSGVTLAILVTPLIAPILSVLGAALFLNPGWWWLLPLAFFGSACVASGLALVFLQLAARREAVVTFSREGIEFTRGTLSLAFSWRQIRGFRDDSADVVQLLGEDDLAGRGASPNGWFVIPTRTEKDRTAVLALLVERGVPRA